MLGFNPGMRPTTHRAVILENCMDRIFCPPRRKKKPLIHSAGIYSAPPQLRTHWQTRKRWLSFRMKFSMEWWDRQTDNRASSKYKVTATQVKKEVNSAGDTRRGESGRLPEKVQNALR